MKIKKLCIGGSSSALATYQSAVLDKNYGYENVHLFNTQKLSIGCSLFIIKDR